MHRVISAASCATLAGLLLLGCSDDPLGGTDAFTDATLDGGFDSHPNDGATDVPSGSCGLNIVTINGDSATKISSISSLLDQDGGTPGIQLDIDVAVVGAPNGTEVELVITGVSPSPKVSSQSGVASFSNVTVDADQPGVVQLTPRAAGCFGTTLTLSAQPDPTCSFTKPNKTRLTSADDAIAGNGAFDYTVIVQTTFATPGGLVRLMVDSAAQPDKVVSANGEARIPVVLSPSTDAAPTVLTATVQIGGLTAICEYTLVVDIEGPACAISGFDKPPVETAKGPNSFGPDQDADGVAPDLQTTVTVGTDVTATSVSLTANGVRHGPVTPTASQATFDLTLADGTSTLSAECADAGGANTSTSPSSTVYVDIHAPAAVSDLSCEVKCFNTPCVSTDPALSNNRKGIITCTWTSADDGTSDGVELYQLRYRTNDAISGANWGDPETNRDHDAVLAVPGPTRTYTVDVTGLTIPNLYSFAVKSVDFLGNVSPISNLPSPVLVDFKRQEIPKDPAPVDSKFGYPIAVGDFNCDGLSDIAVGLADDDTYGTRSGEVQLFFNYKVGLAETFSTKISGTTANSSFGLRLAALNFNGDSYNGHECTDLAVMAPGSAEPKHVYIYLGRPIWPERDDEHSNSVPGPEVTYTFASGACSGFCGLMTLGAADFDGDGLDDLAISHFDVPSVTVYIDLGESIARPSLDPPFTGEERMPMSGSDIEIVGGTAADQFGYPIARAGRPKASVQQEGLLFGAELTQVSANQVGAAYLVRGSSTPPASIDITSSAAVVTIRGTANNRKFGRAVAGLGDLDGDGSAEFAVGDPFENGGAGAVYIFDLDAISSPATADNAKAVIINDLSPNTDNNLGWSIASGADLNAFSGADLNGDGYADILVGMTKTAGDTRGSAYVFRGSPDLGSTLNISQADITLAPVGATTGFSLSSVFVTDVNGDGIVDLIVGDAEYNLKRGRLLVFF